MSLGPSSKEVMARWAREDPGKLGINRHIPPGKGKSSFTSDLWWGIMLVPRRVGHDCFFDDMLFQCWLHSFAQHELS